MATLRLVGCNVIVRPSTRIATLFGPRVTALYANGRYTGRHNRLALRCLAEEEWPVGKSPQRMANNLTIAISLLEVVEEEPGLSEPVHKLISQVLPRLHEDTLPDLLPGSGGSPSDYAQ